VGETMTARDSDGATNELEADRLLTAQQVGAMLSVPDTWVLRESREGRFPTVCIGRYRRYRLSAVRAWMAEQEINAD
jgi:predicted DNA-binding transcriptional regulator AlpA